MSNVLQWIKSNVFIVVFSVVTIAAFVALPFISAGLNEEVEEKLAARKTKFDRMSGLERKQVVPWVPPNRAAAPQNGLITSALVSDYEAYGQAASADAEAAHQWALEFNQKQHDVTVPEAFPNPPGYDRLVLAERLQKALTAAYERLLDEIDAGMPPTLADIKGDIIRAENQWRLREMQADPNAELTPQQQKELETHLGTARLSQYDEAANNLHIYASLDLLNPPQWTPEGQAVPTWDEVYHWQWRYWIVADLLHALDEANQDADTVKQAPVKQILRISTREPEHDSQRGGRSGGGSGGGGAGGGSFGGGGSLQPPGGGGRGGGGALQPPGGGGRGGGGALQPPGGGGRGGGGALQPPGGGGREGAGAPGGTGGKLPDPTAELPRDYTSLTGRTTNHLYDVRSVDLSIVVETARIPDVLNALSKRNFMTITSLQMQPASSYDALRAGFRYGPRPCMQLDLEIETIWMREWTLQYMPDETRQALNIPTEQDTADSETDNTG